MDVETIKIEIMRTGQPADRRLECLAILFAAIDDPLEHAHVLSEAWPKEFSVRAFAKPVHVEDERRIAETFSDVDPMPEIIANVVPAERQHRHRIATHLTDSARCGCSCLGSHGGAEINAVDPIEGLVNQWHSITATTAKNDGAYRNASAFFHVGIESRIIAH